MREKDLLRTIGSIDDEYVKEAEPKRKSKVKTWVKWLSAAAGISLIIVVGVVISQQTDTNKDNEEKGSIDIGKNEAGFPEIGYEVNEEKEGFKYYVYVENGEYKLVEEDVEVSESIEVEAVIDKWMKLNNVADVALNDVRLEHVDAWEQEITIDGNSYVEYRLATDTYSIYLEGNELNNDLAVGLVNTIVSYGEYKPGLTYVRPYLNDELMILDAQMDDAGYNRISVNVQENPEEQWAEDGEYMVDISFVVKDEAGNPMKNLVYNVVYISGERGSYQPGYGITDFTGEFTRSVHPNAVYELHLQKRNQVSYTSDYEATVYEEMTVTLDVTDGFTKEIIWKDEAVTKLAEKRNPVTIDISDVYDGNCEEVFLQLFTEDGGQIQLGYPKKNGEFIWYDGEDGSYYLTLQVFEENDGNTDIKYAKSYVVAVEDGKLDIIEEQKEEVPIPE